MEMVSIASYVLQVIMMKETGTRIVTFFVKGMRMLTRTSFGSKIVFLYPVKKFSSSLISLTLPLKAMKRHVKNMIILLILFLTHYISQGKAAFLTSVVFRRCISIATNLGNVT